jgi:hypothetical protein
VTLFGTAWAQLGAVGLVGIFVLLMATGRLVPRTTAKALVDQANANAARWQAAAEASDERADLVAKQNGELMSALRTVETLVRALNPGPRRDTA